MINLRSGLLGFLLFMTLFTGWTEGVRPSIEPGVYDRNLILRLDDDTGQELFYRIYTGEAHNPGAAASPPILYRIPLHLSALVGEERSYRIETFRLVSGAYEATDTYVFTIDRRPPHAPRIDLATGVYSGSQRLAFLPHGDTIIYSLDKDIAASSAEWRGEVLELNPRPGAYTLYAYAADAAGNTSPLKSWEFTVNGRGAVEEGLTIHSPVAGSFANRQYLYIESQGYDEILYTLDGSNPQEAGLLYREGLLLEQEGDLELAVIGKRRDGTFSGIERVKFAVSPGETYSSLLESGSYQTSQRLNLGDIPLRYTFEERRPRQGDLAATSPINLSAPPRGLAYYALRFRPLENSRLSDREYRYFYLFDTRIPGEPLISIAGDAPYSEPPRVAISAAGYADIYYTLDGTSPTESSLQYNGPFQPVFPADEGSLLIKAVAYGANGRRGEESGALLSFDTNPPAPPQIEERERENGLLSLRITPPAGSDAVFEVNLEGEEPLVPGIDSPVWSGPDIDIPYGMQADIRFRFASRDTAGNVSDPVEYARRIDKLPPPRPVIGYQEGKVFVDAAERVFYKLERIDGGKPRADEYQPFTEAITPPEIPGEMARFRISSYAEDQEGNRSATAVREISVDRRLPKVPFIPGLEDRRIYTDPEKIISFTPTDQDFKLVYTLGRDGLEPPDPTTESPSAADLRIEAGAGVEETLILKLLPIFPQRERIGKVKTIRFGFDRKLPALPDLVGLPASGISPDSIELSLTNTTEEDSYFLLIGESETAVQPLDPVEEGELYTKPVEISTESDTEKSFFIRLAALDPAGNRSLDEKLYTLVIDRRAPVLPELLGFPDTGVSDKDISLRFETDEAVGVEYRLLRTDSLDPPEAIAFKPYSESLLISSPSDQMSTYQLEYRSIDAAGNISPETARVLLTIDKRPVRQPAKPSVTYRDDEGFANLSWDLESGKQLFYRIGPESEYSRYRSPISIALQGENPPQLEYYLLSETGIASATHTFQLSASAGVNAANLVSGAENGRTYAEEVVIQPVLRSTGLIRYEFSTGERLPRVSPYSPVLDDEIRFAIPEGSSKRFRLVFGLFESKSSQLPRMSEELEFTIDRSPPPPPLLTELINPEADSPYKLIELDGRGNETFYSIETPGGESTEFSPYRTTLRLDTREEAGVTVRISAYNVDPVGNRSRTESWAVLLDQDIVYVSPLGNDLYEGTRLRPYRSLEKAIATARQLGKETLYLAEGQYPVQRPVILDFPLELKGGLDAETWRSSGVSVIDTGRYFPESRPILSLTDRHRLEGLRMADSASKVEVPLFIDNADVELVDVSQFAGAEFSRLIEQRRGSLRIQDSVISAETSRGLIYSENGALLVRNSELNQARSSEAMIWLQGGSLRLEQSFLSPGGGDRSSAVEVVNGFTVLQGSEISSGSGGRQAKALTLRGGQLRVEESLFRAESGAHATVLIDANDGELTINDSSFELAGRNGSVGMLIRDGRAKISHSAFISRNQPGYIFLLQQQGGIVEFENTTADLSARSESVLADIEGGRLSLLHNSWLLTSARARSAGFQTRNGAQLYITNSIVSNREDPSGIALSGEDADTWSIRNSNLGGWSQIARYGRQSAVKVEELDLLDGDPFGGWLHANIAESASESFAGELFRLREDSACVDAGVESGGELLDIDGQKRPNPDHGIRPFPDIGADEFYAGR